MKICNTKTTIVELSKDELQEAILFYIQRQPELKTAMEYGCLEIKFKAKPANDYVILPDGITVSGAEITITEEA